MSVSLDDDGVIRLVGACAMEEAESLARLAVDHADAAIDWSGCELAHTAVIQVLLAAGPRVTGTPAGPFLARHICPLVGRN